jgi:hypothetical protein
MASWTQLAKEALDRYFDRLRLNLKSLEIDLSEVLADTKRRIEEEAATAGREVIDEEDVRRILSQINSQNFAKPEAPVESPIPPEISASPDRTRKALPDLFVLLFGVGLPLITLTVELSTRMCAIDFFDPMPTVWHVLLVGFVPLSNLLVSIAVWKGKTFIEAYRNAPLVLGLMNGITIGVAFFYALLFLPITPLALFAILAYGLGFLPLAPLFSLISAILCRRSLKKILITTTSPKIPGLWLGLGLSLALLIVAEIPSTLTRFGLHMATSNSPETKLRGIRWLRTFGDKDLLLRACYQRPGSATDLVGYIFSLGNPVMPNQAREIYYRVTGVPFNAVLPPKLASRSSWWRDFEFDLDQGGTVIGSRLKGLWMTSSRLDSSIDPDASLAYTEWTLVFKNDSNWQREARVQIALPPGGVVSRLTLWINGEEQEAAFSARGKVRQAYQQVVQRRRDPVLVTTSGPDRILVQCFPVPPQGGEMKVRIGITTPLLLESKEQEFLHLPYFLERNFGISEDTQHSVWIESKKPLEITHKTLKSEQPKEGLYAIRGLIKDSELAAPNAIVPINRANDVLEVWAVDSVDKDPSVILQTLEEKASLSPTRVVFVIDGSYNMREALPEIADVLPKLSEGIEWSVLFASDNVLELSGPVQKGSTSLYETIAEQLRKMSGEGGVDNVPALIRGWDIAAESPQSVIVWIHGLQPILLQTTEGLRQRWERRPGNPRLYEIQVGNGPNRIIEKLDGIQELKSVPRFGTLAGDLEKLFSQWRDQPKKIVLVREKVKRENTPEIASGKQTSNHLARLWAYDEVLKRLTDKGKMGIDEAIQLAVNYQLVTPVTGAVVLETQQQYQQAGLEPVQPGTVPTIPEPETWALIVVVAVVLAWILWRQRLYSSSFKIVN